MSKRGQVTIYAILGVLILVTAISGYLARDYISRAVLRRGLEESVIVPEKIRPINSFVVSCLKETAEKGINLIGQQGGYAIIPRDPYPSTQLNLVSNALTVFGNNNIAYWFYEAPNKVQSLQVPTESSMEQQLASYVENNIFDCLNSFEDFPEYEIKRGDLKANTILNENNAEVSINYPLEIKIGDFEFDMDKFSGTIQSPLLELYESAGTIFDYLNSENILEKKTITMLVTYDELPFSGDSTECIPPFWIMENVERDFKRILFHNIGALKVGNTNFELSNDENEYFILNSGLNDNDLDVNFLYSENWPLYLDVLPREGNVLKAQSVTEKLGPLRGLAESFVCLSNYHFIYDVKYPVLIILNKDGYTFQFAMHVVIDNNEPRERTVIAESVEGFDRRICETRKNEITVLTKDINNRDLIDVDINYKCINSQCEIGKSGFVNGEAGLTANYPQCFNGALIGTKEGYHQAKQIISTLESSTTTLFLEPYKDVNADVQIERAGSGKINDEEEVYIQLVENDKGHSQTILYPGQNKIKLIPGNYHAVIYLISNFPEGLDLAEQNIQTCVDVPKGGVISAIVQDTEKKCVTTTIPATTVDKIISGYTEFDFAISQSDLSKNNMLVHVPFIGKPKTLSELSRAFEVKGVPKPEFK